MSRARRLAEIQKANQPAFSGTQWWLAEPAPKASAAEAGSPSAEATTSVLDSQEPVLAAVGAASHQAVAVAEQIPAAALRTVVPAAPVQEPEAVRDTERATDLPSRVSSLKERFLWLGRKHRSIEAQ